MNLLRYSQQQPKISSYACLHGNYDFNHSPLDPSDTKVVVHKTADQNTSWGPHSVQGWYIVPATKHCRCHKCHITYTTVVRYILSLNWFLKQIPFPRVSTEYYPCQTASNILAITSRKYQSQKIPLLDYASDITNTYNKIAPSLCSATQCPPYPPPETLVQTTPATAEASMPVILAQPPTSTPKTQPTVTQKPSKAIMVPDT